MKSVLFLSILTTLSLSTVHTTAQASDSIKNFKLSCDWGNDDIFGTDTIYLGTKSLDIYRQDSEHPDARQITKYEISALNQQDRSFTVFAVRTTDDSSISLMLVVSETGVRAIQTKSATEFDVSVLTGGVFSNSQAKPVVAATKELLCTAK